MKRLTTTKRLIAFFVLPVLLGLAACQSSADAAPQAVEDYLQALVEKDTNRLINLSCAEWEEDARMEVDSFQAVEAKLENVGCESVGESGEYTLVSCTGAIIASYENEDQELSLDRYTYRVVLEGGEWRMCGYE